MATIGKKIKALRERYGESQVDLGRIVSVSDKAVSAWENGKKRPRMNTFRSSLDITTLLFPCL